MVTGSTRLREVRVSQQAIPPSTVPPLGGSVASGFGKKMTTELEIDFKMALLNAVDICIRLYRYRPTYFLRMLDNYGAVGTATQLATAIKFHEGFTKLWELGRLDLTVEAIMLRRPYRQLFPKEVLDKASDRLKALGYKE